MPKIIRPNGISDGEPSTFCPKCGENRIERTPGSTQDFDEDGWFERVRWTCQTPKCKHVFYDKVCLTGPSIVIR